MYKDSSYKEAKWKEIAEILHLNKEEVIRKWKSLRDNYVRHKNNKSRSGMVSANVNQSGSTMTSCPSLI